MKKRKQPEFKTVVRKLHGLHIQEFTLIVVLLAAAVLSHTALTKIATHERQMTASVRQQMQIDEYYFQQLIKSRALRSALQGIEVKAESALVANLTTGEVFYQKQPDTPRNLASLVKIATADIALESIEESAMIPVRERDIRLVGDFDMLAGESYSRDALVRLIVTASANDAASALKNAIPDWAVKFQEYQNSLQSQTVDLANETGWDFRTQEFASIGTTRDVLKMIQKVNIDHESIKSSINDQVVARSDKDNIVVLPNTNTKRSEMPGLVFSKTGYTDLAGGNLAVAVDAPDGNRYAVIVLASGFFDRFDDVVLITNQLYRILEEL